MSVAIAVDGLSVTIDGTHILSDVTISVPTGKIVGLLGPSGAGKTTLIRAILGLQKPTSGSIDVLGQKAGSRQLKTKVGYVTQSSSVYADLTVLENLKYFADLAGVSYDEVQSVLHTVELEEHQDSLAGTLSGGQRARVSLATALLGQPPVLVLDEPTVGLDPVLRQKLWKLFNQLSKDGTTILISSHVMDEAEKCDSLVFMREGRVLIADTRKAVISKTGASSMEDAFLKLATKKGTA